MTGGNRSKADYDGYGATPEELEQAEQEHQPWEDLHALEQGLKHLQLARAWLMDGGYVIPRVQEEIGQIKLAIGLLRAEE